MVPIRLAELLQLPDIDADAQIELQTICTQTEVRTLDYDDALNVRRARFELGDDFPENVPCKPTGPTEEDPHCVLPWNSCNDALNLAATCRKVAADLGRHPCSARPCLVKMRVPGI
eukprot:4933549-Amphidinium_carterae.1